MKDSKKLRTIIFNVLVILTIVFIYIFFFPKKSYVKEKIDNGLNPIIESTFKENINNMKIAGETYFESNENGTITLEQLMNNNLIAELKDSNSESCDTSSYVEKNDKTMKIHLSCKDKSGDRYINLSDGKFLCIYQYEKKTEEGYTNWSEWSEWQQEAVEPNELRNVETEIRKESDGKKIVTDTREESVAATYHSNTGCREGTTPANGKCMSKVETGQEQATKNSKGVYKCPRNTLSKEYVLEGSICKIYSIYYENETNQSYYTCPNGYWLSGSTCYRTTSNDREEETFKDVTYYRYQTRQKIEAKNDIKWSIKDDQELLNQAYTMVGEISCEF